MAKSKTTDFIEQCGYERWNRKETVKLLNRYYQWFNLKEQNTFEQQEKYMEREVKTLKIISKLKEKENNKLRKENEKLKLEINSILSTSETLKKSIDLMSAEKSKMHRRLKRLGLE